jgi:hypothetical protein
MKESTTLIENCTFLGPNDEPVAVEITFKQFVGEPVEKYWHSARAADGQIVEPWKDGTFQKGDGTLLRWINAPAFTRKLPQDS